MVVTRKKKRVDECFLRGDHSTADMISHKKQDFISELLDLRCTGATKANGKSHITCFLAACATKTTAPWSPDNRFVVCFSQVM